MTKTKAILLALLNGEPRSRLQVSEIIEKEVSRDIFYYLKGMGYIEEMPVAFRITPLGERQLAARTLTATEKEERLRKRQAKARAEAKKLKAKRDKVALRERTKRVNAELSAARAGRSSVFSQGSANA